jgi:hypothetical protein
MNGVALKSMISVILIVGAGLALTVPFDHAQTAGVNGQAAANGSIRAQLIGSWRLVSRQSRRANGELEVDPGLSAVPLGVLIYDQSGHVAAQLSRRDRTVAMIGEECQVAATTKGTPDTAQTIFGYDAYFGTYRINEQEYYDGPRQGIANFNGQPHFYDCIFDERRDEYSNWYHTFRPDA